jgi:hypothetical protein
MNEHQVSPSATSRENTALETQPEHARRASRAPIGQQAGLVPPPSPTEGLLQVERPAVAPSGSVRDRPQHEDLPQRASPPSSPSSAAASVELNIEQLVLHGFSRRDRYRIARAMQRELTRLFTEHGVPASLTTASSIHRLDAGDFALAANVRAETVGARVAQSVYRGMSK